MTSNDVCLDYFDKGSLVERIYWFPFEISVFFDGGFEFFFDVSAEQRQCPRLGFVRFMMALEPFTVINPCAFVVATGHFVSITVHSNFHLLADFHVHIFCAILQIKRLLQFIPVCDNFGIKVFFTKMRPPVALLEYLWVFRALSVERHPRLIPDACVDKNI